MAIERKHPRTLEKISLARGELKQRSIERIIDRRSRTASLSNRSIPTSPIPVSIESERPTSTYIEDNISNLPTPTHQASINYSSDDIVHATPNIIHFPSIYPRISKPTQRTGQPNTGMNTTNEIAPSNIKPYLKLLKPGRSD